MASTTWRIRHQTIRSGRSRSSKKNKHVQDISKLLNEDPQQSFNTILTKICEKDIDEERLLNYLNVLVKLTLRIEGKFDQIGLDIETILICLRMMLTHDSTQIRTGGMRCIRYVLKTEADVITMNKLLIPYLISRSLDLVMKYDGERIEAMKLIRKVLIVTPANFDLSIARNLVALSNEGSESKDRMLRTCLATLSELGVLNLNLFISCGGVAAITRNLLECQTPKIAESLCGVLLLLLDREETRSKARVDLHSVAAPFCDFHYKHGWKEKNSNRRDERELRLNCSRLALLTILRSWPGILHFCGPNDKAGFKAIVDVLHLNQLEVRKAVLDLLYELLGLPQPEWTDELSVALSAVDPCEPQASWRLNEGFVAAEGRSLLPHLAKTTPSITDIHLALLLYCFLENGLLVALTEVIATSDTFISVRATVLLGELLRLIQVFLPPECCNISPSLPALLDYAVGNKPQAMGAVTALQQLNKLMKRRPASYSLHLDYILRGGCEKKPLLKHEKTLKHKQNTFKTKLHQFVLKNAEDTVKETGVLLSNDAFTWNWNLINILFTEPYREKIDLLDSSHKTFIKRLVEFYMPSKNKYSHMDLSSSKVNLTYTTTGIQLIDYLLNLKEHELSLLLLELFKDILNNILAIGSSKSVHDCLFSPQHMLNTHCQSYYLFIGRVAVTKNGINMLNSIDMFDKLETLATTTNHDCYVKLIISSLDYSVPGPARHLLNAVLVCGVESSRLYATQFLLVLLRAGIRNFHRWGIELLVKQLNDQSRSVYLSALATLHEACEVPEYLESLIQLNPSLDVLQEKNMLLLVRLLSSETGLNKLNRNHFVSDLILKWNTFFNFRYVRLIENEISDALTLHQRNDNGKYDKRASSSRSACKKDVFLMPHLYGQLNQYSEGFKLLMNHGNTEIMINNIIISSCGTDEEILQLKSSLWAMGHLSTSLEGFELLKSHNLLGIIIELVQNCPVYSIRATAFYVLGLIGTTRSGAEELFTLDWVCTRHNRHDYWPINHESIDIFNEHYTFLSDDLMSIGNSYLHELENIDEDSMESAFPTLSSPAESQRVRQLTLPSNKSPPIIFHQRSLSESKTFDISLEEYHNEKWKRMRNSSVTESTTSGVSSCDSHLGGKQSTAQDETHLNAIFLSDQRLSTIPSSSSLTTVIAHMKSNSESSNRISTNSTTNSDVSTSSVSGSFSNKLAFQDVVGYSTLRKLRRLVSSDNGDEDEFRNYVRQNPNFLSPRQSSVISDLSILDSQFTSMFSVQKFPINATIPLCEEKRFMGICLPQNLEKLFPDANLALRKDFTQIDSEISVALNTNTKSVKHVTEKCFKCSRQEDNAGKEVFFQEKKDALKIEILRNIERLANPIWCKHVKQLLIQAKQREPDLFKDFCIYSQACAMLSENAYRLNARRFVHELFLEIAFKNLYEQPKNILECDSKKDVHKMEACREDEEEELGATSPTEIKSLDTLKLIYKENKFPIRNN